MSCPRCSALPASKPRSPRGANVLPLVEEDDAAPLRDFIYGRAQEFHAITEKKFKYLFCGNGGDELLFDLENDPMETQDLVSSEVHQGELDRLRKCMATYLETQGEPLEKRAANKEKSHAQRSELNAATWHSMFTRAFTGDDVLHYEGLQVKYKSGEDLSGRLLPQVSVFKNA